jgi:hypothetical protein
VAILAFALRVQVAIQTGTHTENNADVSAPNDIGRLGSTGRTRNVTSADPPSVGRGARRLHASKTDEPAGADTIEPHLSILVGPSGS